MLTLACQSRAMKSVCMMWRSCDESNCITLMHLLPVATIVAQGPDTEGAAIIKYPVQIGVLELAPVNHA